MLNVDQICKMITNNSNIAMLICVSIISCVALRPLYQAWFTIKHANRDLTAASKILKNLGDVNQLRAFYSQFDLVGEKISEIRCLKQVWNKFVISLFFTASKDSEGLNLENQKIYLSHLPSSYFSRDTVLGLRMNLSQFLAYPNYLIGLGLTFTFIGLAAALHVAQAGLSHGDGQQALRELLSVASVKFISSIAGIFFSLIVTAVQKTRLKTFQTTLDEFCNLLEKYTEYKPAEKLLFDTYQVQSEHTNALNSMANDISEGISSVLSNQLSSSVASALEPLAKEIRELAQKFSGSNENALESVLQEFLAQLRKSSGDEMNGLVESVTTLKGSLDTLVGNIQGMSESFGSNTKDSCERLISMLESFVITFEPVQHGIRKFGESLANLENIAGNISQASGSMSGAADISNQSMSNLARTVNEIATNLDPMQELLSSLNFSLRKVDESSEKLSAAGSKIAYAADGFKNSAESIDQAGGRFDQKIKTFESVVDGISGTVSVLERVSGHMNDAIQPLSETSLGFTKALQVIHETENRIQDSHQQLGVMLVDLQKFTETVPTLWQQYEGRFDKVDDDLKSAFEALAKGSDDFRSSVQGFVSSLDEPFERALRTLGGAIQELRQEREDSQITLHSNNTGFIDADSRLA